VATTANGWVVALIKDPPVVRVARARGLADAGLTVAAATRRFTGPPGPARDRS